MNRIDCTRPAGVGRQRGTTLIVALVLLLLATLLAVFAMNVGIFAQRTSAADMRARVIHQTLEGALADGVEYIRNNRQAVIANALTHQCAKDDVKFPCGTVPLCATGFTPGSGTTCTDTTLARRANSFYYFNSSGPGYDVNGNGSTDQLDEGSLPIGSQRTTTAGNGFTVNYGVGAVMCMVKNPTAITDPTKCTVDPTDAQGTYLFTVTAIGNMAGESANTTLTMTFGESPIASGLGNAPTLIASGTVDLTGTGQLVTNNNGAGNGLPLTVWSPECSNQNGAGTVNSCFMEDWMRQANGYNSRSQYTFAKNYDGSDSTVVTCSGNGAKTCSCSNSLSAGSGNLTEGPDILTNDSKGGCTSPHGDPPVYGTSSCTTTANCKANYDVQEPEFPCDLFRYIFKTKAWDDLAVQSPGTANTLCVEAGAQAPTGGGDCFCEYHKPVTTAVANGSQQTIGVDEQFLYAKALYIYDTNDTSGGTHDGWASPSKLVSSCALLFSKPAATGGLVWDRSGTCLGGTTGQIGYPDKPILLVSDGNADLQGATFFGLLFVRDTTAAGSSTSTYGGTANFVTHSTGTIYGSVIVQGPASKINGNSAIVYQPTVMNALLNADVNYAAAPVPGSWTDRYAY